VRLVPDHAVVLVAEAFQRYCSKHRTDPRPAPSASPSCRPRTNWPRSAWSSARLERRARLHRHLGPGHLADEEFIGLAYFAEIPAVTIIDVQRGGPSTGMPTRTQQSDLLACAYASHGDTKHVLLFPEDPHECFEFAAQALDLADRLQTPVFVMTRPRHRHEPAPVQALRLGRRARNTTAAR
jgi:2-oxoglutarate ferredoxin oxidoreductase subunit alpha